MTERYRQFLGTEPGIAVEVVDSSSSPHLVRTEDGFEFYVSAEDLKNYYKKEGAETPAGWKHMVTDPDRGFVESPKMARLMEIVRSFVPVFRDMEKARSFAREAVRAFRELSPSDREGIRNRLQESGWDMGNVSDEHLKTLEKLPDRIGELLLSETAGVIPFLGSATGLNGEAVIEKKSRKPAGEGADAKPKIAKKKAPATQRGGMKNVELAVDGDILTVTVDLSKEFGPSKSGKTTIVASTVGNKTVPGREEKIGMNVYKQETKKPGKGRRNEFKNLLMSINGDILTVSVDLSKEYGPSKSGQTIIIASSEGNQLVYGREEKIGMNVYRKIE